MSDLCIGDVRDIHRIEFIGSEEVMDSWELKALAQYKHSYGFCTWCEPIAWDLGGNSYTVDSKLETYLWGQFDLDSEIWE